MPRRVHYAWVMGGWIHDASGSYSWAFISGALLAFVAAGLTLAIREEPAYLPASLATTGARVSR